MAQSLTFPGFGGNYIYRGDIDGSNPTYRGKNVIVAELIGPALAMILPKDGHMEERKNGKN
jgi:hypothetical protein